VAGLASDLLRIFFGCFRSRSEEDPKETGSIYGANPCKVAKTSEAVPKNATLLGCFYVGNKLFFVYDQLTVNKLNGVAPPRNHTNGVFSDIGLYYHKQNNNCLTTKNPNQPEAD
jgi:hypothetical protein